MDILKETKNLRLGEILVESGYITAENLEKALELQRLNPGARIGDILVREGFITEHNKLEALAAKLGLPLVSLDMYSIETEAVARIPQEVSRKYGLIAIGENNGVPLVAVSDPLNLFALEEVRQALKSDFSLCLAESARILAAADLYYSEVRVRREVSNANESSSLDEADMDREITTEEGDEAPVVRVLNSLLIRGFNTNASDIHIEPFADKVTVRIRVDGAILDYTELKKNLHRPVIARIKILAGLDIAERRSPQDGHFRMDIEGTDLNIRVSVMPTVFGEKAVLRFLNGNTHIDRAETFGMPGETYALMMKALMSPHGIVYITGPTGSGKTTTLYMILEYLSSRQVNIATVEDPVERNIPRVNQSQVNPLAGLTFETGLRAILRQDPDIIMVGETRDEETATISVRAAITGHLVLSTLHTNDAVSAIARLVDMGVPRYMIANSVVAVMAQRLVRKICPDCAYEYEPDEAERALIGSDIKTLKRGRGCNKCSHTGYRGRMAVHEIVFIDRELRAMISRGAITDELLGYAVTEQGARTLRESALELLKAGVTTVEEFIKTAYFEGLEI